MSGSAPEPARPADSPAVENPYAGTPWTSTRSLKQMSKFFFGAACFLASTAITRRAVYKRSLRIKPEYFSPNTNPHEHFSPFHDALLALGLATINCVSVGTMMLGGALWSVDISNIAELRAITRSRLDYDTIYAEDEDEDADESLETSILRKRGEAGEKSGAKPLR